MKAVAARTGLLGWICAALVLAGAGATAFGLSTHSGDRLLWATAREVIYFVLFFAVAAYIFGRESRFSRTFELVLAFVGFALLAGQLWALLICVAFASASYLLGGFLLGKLGLQDGPELRIHRFLAGAGTYGLVVGGLAHFPVNYPGVYTALVAAPLWVWRGELVLQVRACMECMRMGELQRRPRSIVRGALCALVLVHFVYALMPELGYDALTLHLLVPSQLLHRHEWGFDPSLYAMALIPMLGDWIFSVGYLLGGETASRLINLSFSYLLAYQCYRLAIWLGADSNWSDFAPLLLLSTPLMFTETNSLHVEGLWSCFLIGGAIGLFRIICDADVQPRSIAVAGLLLGMAANAKAITFLFLVPLGAICLLCWSRLTRRISVARISVALIGFIVVAALPYAVAYWISGNPVFPFYNGHFKSEHFPAQNFNNALYNSGLGWLTIYLAVFDAGRYIEGTTGASGFQWLLLMPAVLVGVVWLRSFRSSIVLVLIVVATYLVFGSQSYLRYVLPVYALGGALMVAVLSRAETLGNAEKLLGTVFYIVVGLNVLFFCSATWTYRSVPWGLVVNSEYRDRYLLKMSPVRLAVDAVNRINTQESPVAFFTQETYGAGLKANALYPNWYNQKFSERVQEVRSAADLANAFASYGVEYFIVAQDWGTENLRRAVEVGSDEVVRFSRISVRKLKDATRFGIELLKNPELIGGTDWVISPGARLSEQGVLASVTDPIVQGLAIEPGRRYRNEVTARCATSRTQGRVQVNWEDGGGKIIASDIKVFDCSESDSTHRQEVVAPVGAKAAIVFGGSNTADAIRLTRISFR